MSTNRELFNVQLDVKFTEASSRANITSEENIAVSFGKLSKWYEALVPTGGSSGKILVWNSSGTAKWNDPLHPTIIKSADTTSTASPAHGGTFTTVDSITRDANGHVTTINTKTVTLPSDQNTDTKVTQSSSTTSDFRPLLLGKNNQTNPENLETTVTDQTYVTKHVFVQPSTGDLTLYNTTGDSPALIFRRGTMIDNTLEWRIQNVGGKLNFDRDKNESTETWENILQLDPTNNKLYFKNTEVSLSGHTHNYVPNTQTGMNAAINLLATGSSDPQLADYYIAQYAGGGTTTTTYHRRPISALWNTFKSLITVGTTGSGNAVTSVSIANDGNNRKITFTKGSTFLTSHQSVTDGNPTLSWGTQSTVATIGSTDIHVTMPANPNTDTKVTQSSSTTSNYRPVILGYTNTTTVTDLAATVTNQVYATTSLFHQPSTGYLYATAFSTKGYLTGSGAQLITSGLWLKAYKVQADESVFNYSGYAIRTYSGKARISSGSTGTGYLLTIGGGGLTVVGSGESAASLADLISDDQSDANTSRTTLNVGGTLNTSITGSTEELLLSSDNNIYFITKCNTIADRKPVVLDTNSYFYPGTTGTGSIGTSTYKWNSAYINTIYEGSTKLSDKYAPISHTHGNITNGGALQTTDITITNGDKLVVTDSSDSNKVARTSISFDGSTATKCLTQKGTWETFASSNTDTKVNVTLATTTKAYLLGTSTTPTATATAVTSVADTGVYLDTTAGTLCGTSIRASSTLCANTAKSGTDGGIALYSTDPATYGIIFRNTSNKGKHGYVQSDWATYFTMNNAATRGWVFNSQANVASISGAGNAVFNGSVTVGGNTTNTSGCRMEYNSSTQSLDFVFV